MSRRKSNSGLPEGLTIAAVAAALHVHHGTIRRRVEEGDIPCVKIAGRGKRGVLRIPRAWLERKLGGGRAA